MRTHHVAALTLTLATTLLVACQSGTSYDRNGLVAIEKEGRLYVFEPGSEAYDEFEANGELGKSVTRIGAGPDGKTVVAADTATVETYLR